jgi:hypothetical protein
VVGRQKLKLVGNPGGSMAKVIEGTDAAVPIEEIANEGYILSVPIPDGKLISDLGQEENCDEDDESKVG